MTLNYRKSYEIVGWTADADMYCLTCALEGYGVRPGDETTRRDGEGNPVHPVFLDETSSEDTCGHCGERLDD